MSSNQQVEQALQSTQRQLFRRFTSVLLLCLILIEIIAAAMFCYDLYRVEKKNLSSLSIEYQRILKFESEEKLIHVLEQNPQRLIESNIAVFMISPSKPAVFIAGDLSLPADLDFSSAELNGKFWFEAFISEPHMAIKIAGNSHEFWLVLSNQARYPKVVRQLQVIFISLLILMFFTSMFIHRLIRNTMSPLATLGSQLDKLSHGPLSTFSQPLDSSSQEGLDIINHSVYSAISRLQHVICTMDATVDAIAHDIRTPLSRITLASERALLSAVQKREQPKELESALSDCAEYAAQASNMLTALLRLNDELTGKRQAQQAPTDINEVFNRVAHWYEDIAEEKAIAISCIAPANAVFNIDADKLTQILVNLLDNALKYTGVGGEVTLSASCLTDTSVQIKVADTGIGIASEHHDLIFKRLYRVDSSRSNAEGYGLGLSLALAMLGNIGGTLTVDSSLGKGSTFTILLNTTRE